MNGSKTSPSLVMLSAGALLLTSCGSEGNDGETGNRIFTEAISPMRHFNPAIEIQPSTDQVGGAVYEPLVRMTDEFEVTPWLAHDWETSEDELTATFHLVETTWHDGEPFTSEDVEYNLKEVLPIQPYGGTLASRIADIETPDDHTVVLHFEEPYGPLFSTLTVQHLLPQHLYEGTDILTNPANTEPVGTGPLVIESFEEGSEVVASANPEYWGGELAFDQAVFPFTSDTNARDLAIVAGDIDRARNVSPSSVDDFSANPDLEVSERASVPQFIQLAFNTENEILDDRELRALINSAIDRERITEVALPETSTVEPGIFPQSLSWASALDVDLAETFAYDPDEINAALDEAGYPRQDDGTRFSLDLRYMSILPELSPVASAMQASFEEVGIELNLIGEDPSVFNDRIYTEGDFDLAIWLGTTSRDPSHALLRWYTCNPDLVAGQNASRYCDEELQNAFEASLSITDPGERAEHFHEIERRVEEIMVSVPVVFNTGLLVHNHARWDGVDNPRHLLGQMDWIALSPKN